MGLEHNGHVKLDFNFSYLFIMERIMFIICKTEKGRYKDV